MKVDLIKNKIMSCRQLLRDESLDKDFRITKVELELIRIYDLICREDNGKEINKISKSS